MDACAFVCCIMKYQISGAFSSISCAFCARWKSFISNLNQKQPKYWLSRTHIHPSTQPHAYTKQIQQQAKADHNVLQCLSVFLFERIVSCGTVFYDVLKNPAAATVSHVRQSLHSVCNAWTVNKVMGETVEVMAASKLKFSRWNVRKRWEKLKVRA